MKLDDLKKGAKVEFTSDAGLEADREYEIFLYDAQSATVRLENTRGSYSIYDIVGLALPTHIPKEDTGIVPTALPKIPSADDVVIPSVESTAHDDVLADLDAGTLLDALNAHLSELIKHPDELVKYHSRCAIRIIWHLEESASEEQKENTKEENDSLE